MTSLSNLISTIHPVLFYFLPFNICTNSSATANVSNRLLNKVLVFQLKAKLSFFKICKYFSIQKGTVHDLSRPIKEVYGLLGVKWVRYDKMDMVKISINFAKIFAHSFPLAKTAQTTLLDLVNFNSSVQDLLFACKHHHHFTIVYPPCP